MSGSSGTAAALAAANGSQATPVEEEEQQAVLALAAAAAAVAAHAQHLNPPGGSPLDRSRSRSLGSGGGTVSPLSEDGTDDLNDQQAGLGTTDRRHSGSLSTLDPSDWRASDTLPPLQAAAQQQQGGTPHHRSQQQQQQHGSFATAAQGGQQQQGGYMLASQQVQLHTLHLGQGQSGDAPPTRGRRNARQQEQNKQAQQRYRAKRKAQFEELQRRVQQLSSEAAGAQRHRQENEKLRAEVAKLKGLLQAGGSLPAAAGAASEALQQPQSLHVAPSARGAPNLVVASRPVPPAAPAAVPASGSGATAIIGGGGAFKPTATARPLAPATLAELPRASTHPLAAAIAALAPPPPQPAPAPAKPPSGRQVHAALELYYQDLQSFATSVKLERVPTDGAGLGAEAALKLTELVRTGVELIKMVLQTSGPDAASLLTAGMASVGPDGMSPGDSLAQWRMVAARVGLTPEQHLLLSDWRRRFLQRLDDCYGRRLLHKAQLAQLPAGGSTVTIGGAGGGGGVAQPQWVEALLLQAAESVGFSACALACAQLEGVVSALSDNLKEERSTACAMMTELLDQILTKVQAARFLLAGHPFCWNGLSFALAAASIAPGSSVAIKQEQQPLSELLARLQSAGGGAGG